MFSSSSLLISVCFILKLLCKVCIVSCLVIEANCVPLKLNDSLFEGDILMETRKSNSKVLRNAVKERTYTWSDAVVPYYIDIKNIETGGLPVLFEVFKELEKETCLKFREKLPKDINYLYVTNLGGCWSFVGRQSDRVDGQELSLGPLCWERATVSHEVMHSLGFFHEHSRYDRDKYIDIILDNVELKHWNQFDKRSPDETDLLTDYDYTSILHYHAYAWAKDKTVPTIKAKKPTNQIGQRNSYSALDIEKINKLYHCYDKVKIIDTHDDHREHTTISVPLIPPPPKPKLLPECDRDQFCPDLDPLCPNLAMQGWCEMMPGKMLFECRRSCCNCYNTRCQDTNVEFYWKNFCFSGNYFDGIMHQTIYYPSTCFSKFTWQSAYDFCPKMCNRC